MLCAVCCVLCAVCCVLCAVRSWMRYTLLATVGLYGLVKLKQHWREVPQLTRDGINGVKLFFNEHVTSPVM